MNRTTKIIITHLLLLVSLVSSAQKEVRYKAIYSGIPWFDEKGNVVSAHGACIIIEGDKFYLFGEKHTDTSNVFAGFTCYSSRDLYNWKFETIALPVQSSGKLGPTRVGERVKVMKCLKTGEYVMYMHVDTLGYKDQFVGYATASRITGPYTFQGPLLFNGKPIRKWDMGIFQDHDGAGYVLLHGGDIYKLGDDYKSVIGQVSKAFDRELEAPTIFRKDSIYYFLGSHLSSWEKNDNYYFTATSLQGPWIQQGLIAPESSLTWYSQATFVLPIQGSKVTRYMFMGDRWSFPKQASAATYVWQPLMVSGTSLSMPRFMEAWRINKATGEVLPVSSGAKTISIDDAAHITRNGRWVKDTLSVRSSNEKGASLTLKFKGTQVGFYGLSRPDGGYASVTLTNSSGRTIVSSIVDMYCKYPVTELKFLSPVLKKDDYTLKVSVMGERGNWSDKRRSDYGSTGYLVSLDRIVISK
jgi:hypothetical protein